MPNRKIFYFSILGVAFRDAELFKSYVRVLNFNLQYQWLHRETSPDLIIYGEEAGTSISPDETGAVYTLRLTALNTGDDQCLSLPLNSVEIAAALNRIGMALGGKTNGQKMPTVPVSDLAQPYRLKRWPPSSLINTRDRIRLATVMTRQAISIETLNKKSGLDIETCKSFVFDLYASGLLAKESIVTKVESSHQSAVPAYVQPGVLSRIRSKLSRIMGNE
ncbi:hypothetical protein H8L32_17845 [Undibacterium sp. CY18W]|uniref:Uncharacterized protein n=1 Tax=Undibacterium hunanense TaxID=2762292 RepID=A0ABR6ZUU9_9BURK|nr:hypothetical protein [Undibacterium hunanense]MBC3919358.1 hypothetical protein [Undibacterium hunanense]